MDDEDEVMPRKDFEAHLAIDDVTVTGRDVEMLRAIDRHGSMHRAAAALDRSYAHLQRRVVELESAAGQLTERKRGGSEGGGTELTPAAHEILGQFSRLRAELRGVASVTESVIPGTVRDREGEIGTVETEAGPVTALVPADATEVAVIVRSDAVVLRRPDGATDTTSLRNDIEGTVTGIEMGEAVAQVTVELPGAVELVALVTDRSLATLDLEPGSRAVASFKATATRGIDRTD